MFYIFAEIFDISNCSHPSFFWGRKNCQAKTLLRSVKKKEESGGKSVLPQFFFSIPISPLALF